MMLDLRLPVIYKEILLVGLFGMVSLNPMVNEGPTQSHRLLLISFDGFRWNYLERTETPHFDRIIREGVHARRGLKNAFVTKTFPNHYTLTSGLWEESHGIVANDMYDPRLNRTFEKRNMSAQDDPAWFDVGAEPIWVTNQLQNKDGRSGVVMWPGGGAPVKKVAATHFIHYDGTMKNETKMDQVVQWFLDGNNTVNLGLVYFNQPDSFGHWYGPESDQVTRMIGGLDQVVGYLLRRLEETGLLNITNLIITSDHGFSATPHNQTIQLDNYVDPALYRVLTGTPTACIWPHQGKLDEVYNALKAGSEHSGKFIVYKREKIPARYHYSKHYRISPILAVAQDTYSFNMTARPYVLLGDHGYDNELQSMHPFFVAMGPAFKKNFSVETFQSVDVYPLMCHLLQLAPAPNNGTMDIVSQLLVNTAPQNYSNYVETIAVCVFASVCVTTVGIIFALAAWRRKSFDLTVTT